MTLSWSLTPSATTYSISYMNNGQTQNITTSTMITLTGLVPGSLYTFSLTATGAGGQSNSANLTSSTGNCKVTMAVIRVAVLPYFSVTTASPSVKARVMMNIVLIVLAQS